MTPRSASIAQNQLI